MWFRDGDGMSNQVGKLEVTGQDFASGNSALPASSCA